MPELSSFTFRARMESLEILKRFGNIDILSVPVYTVLPEFVHVRFVWIIRFLMNNIT